MFLDEKKYLMENTPNSEKNQVDSYFETFLLRRLIKKNV